MKKILESSQGVFHGIYAQNRYYFIIKKFLSPQGVTIRMITIQTLPGISPTGPSLTLVFTSLCSLIFYLKNLVKVGSKEEVDSKKNRLH